MRFPFFVLLALTLVVAGCATNTDPTRDWSAQRFYKEATTALDSKDYATAIKYFELLETRYPYGTYAEQAQLDVTYAYYKDSEPASAIAAAERFIRLHPTHPNVDYAYYMKGLASFQERDKLFDRLRGKDDLSNRDPTATRDAYETFRQLVTRFPNSKYAPDARARMAHLLNVMAGYELRVAEFYYERGAYVATANRTKAIIERYGQSPLVEDALALQAKAYRKLGLYDLARDTLRVLKANFPGSQYLKGEERVVARNEERGKSNP